MGIQDNSFSMVSKSCQDQNLSTVKSHQSLTVFYKLDKQKKQICHSIASVKPEMICMTEVPLKTASLPIDDCELQIQGFDCFYKQQQITIL